MVAKGSASDKLDSLVEAARELSDFIRKSAENASTFDEVERGVVQRVLRLGRQSIDALLSHLGNGDLGETCALPDGTALHRLPETHTREITSVFGRFTLDRAVYGTRERQKIELVPLDTRLALPEGTLSYLLEDWNGYFITEQPFGQVAKALERILGLEQHVDTLERMSERMADSVEAFRKDQPTPPAKEEGDILVRSGDGKGVPIRRPADRPKIEQHRSKVGPKPDRKRMAIVGTVYTVDPYVRTPDQVLEDLFRDPRDPNADRPKRPRPRHKRVWASLSYVDAHGEERQGIIETFAWLGQEVERRRGRRPVVNVMDGQESLWEGMEMGAEPEDRIQEVDILDLLHVTPRLWKAVALFHPVESTEATRLLRDWTLRILRGEVKGVVRGLRQMAGRRQLSANRRQTLEGICHYFAANAERMRYHEYLAKGYPIASGAVEGACRHLVKDRMERTGMSWTLQGAQSMLDLRSVSIGDAWEDFIAQRHERETARLHPHREEVLSCPWAVAI